MKCPCCGQDKAEPIDVLRWMSEREKKIEMMAQDFQTVYGMSAYAATMRAIQKVTAHPTAEQISAIRKLANETKRRLRG